MVRVEPMWNVLAKIVIRMMVMMMMMDDDDDDDTGITLYIIGMILLPEG